MTRLAMGAGRRPAARGRHDREPSIGARGPSAGRVRGGASRMLRGVQRLTVALAQIAPRLGALEANLATHHALLDEARGEGRRPGRLPRARADRLPAPGPRVRGRDAARRSAAGGSGGGDARACRRSCRSSRNRPITGCSSRPPCSRTARSATSTASCSCRPTACSTSAASSPPATCSGRCRRGSASGIGIGDLRGLLAPARAAAPGARRRPDPDQRVVVAGPRPRGDQRGRPRHRDFVADADAHLCPADHLVRHLLQPRRGGRVDLVLGRLRGHRPDRPGRLLRAALRRGPVHGRDRDRPTSGASGWPCRCCATSGRSSMSASCSGSWRERAGMASDSTAEAGARGRGSTSRPAVPPGEPIGFGTHAERAPAPRALDRGA